MNRQEYTNVIALCRPPEIITDAEITRIRDMAPAYQLIVPHGRDELEAVLPHIEIAAGDFPRELAPRAPQLRWWQHWYAGVDWLMDQPELNGLNFTLTNVSGLHAVPITEHIFGMLLAIGRDLTNVIRAQQRKEWIAHERDDVFELDGKTMLLIGVGGIGSHTAQVAQAFGMRVIAVRRHPERSVSAAVRTVGTGALTAVLPEADFVVNTLPFTPDTHKLIGETELRAMRPTAYFVNIGRGKTVDETALIRALREGWIAGAALDVFETEPLPPDSPLWEMENVLVSPHYAGQTNRYDDRAMAIFLDNLQCYVSGKPLRNVVDRELGY